MFLMDVVKFCWLIFRACKAVCKCRGLPGQNTLQNQSDNFIAIYMCIIVSSSSYRVFVVVYVFCIFSCKPLIVHSDHVEVHKIECG